MKKLLSLLLIATMSTMLFAGCGEIKANPTEAVQTYVDLAKNNAFVTNRIASIMFPEPEEGEELTEEEKKAEEELLNKVVENFASRVSVKFISSDVDKSTKTAVVKAEVSGVDMLSYYKNFTKASNEILSSYVKLLISQGVTEEGKANASNEQLETMDEQLYKAYTDTILSDDTLPYVTSVEFNLKYDKGTKEWIVDKASTPIEEIVIGNMEELNKYIESLNAVNVEEIEPVPEANSSSEVEISKEGTPIQK